MSSRKNPFCRKSSAPSTGKKPSYDMYDSCSTSSSTPVSQHTLPLSLKSDSGSQFCDHKPRLMSCQSHESMRSTANLRSGSVSVSSPPATNTSVGQGPMAGSNITTVLSVNILNHPVILPVHLRAPPPHTPGMRQHKLLCRTQSLQTCHSCLHNSCERPQRASRTHEPGVYRVSPGAQEQEAEWLVRGRSRLSDRARRCCVAPGEDCSQSSGFLGFGSLLHTSPTGKLTRTRSSPIFGQHIIHHGSMKTHRTGLVYNPHVLKSLCIRADSSSSPEHAGNQSVLSRLHECGLRNQCQWVQGRQATLEELQVVQPESSSHPYGTNPLSRLHLAKARLAAGSVTELALRVAQGELKNGFAIVKPHEHDASLSSDTKPISVAIAAKQLQCRLNVSKILIVDWDVHHSSMTQDVFYTDPKVLYISLHRHGYGTPNSERGGPREVGCGPGEGYNVNVAWSADLDCPVGDAEYLTAFRTVVMPIAREFSPDVVLVSSEFSAVEGHPAASGGHNVSATCFGLLTRQLMEVAQGRVVLALEGGHDLRVIWDASEACIKALLDNEVAALSEDAVMNRTCAKAMQSLQIVLQIQSKYWCSVRAMMNTLAQRTCSAAAEATEALASLSMAGHKSTSPHELDELFWCCHDQNQPMEHDENKSIT